MADIPQTRFAHSGEVDLAYQIFGAGEDLVAIPGLPSHLEVMWELAEQSAFLSRLASFRRVIMFDKRGTGMSDPVPGVPALEEHVDDISTVMDAAGSARACIAGWADGAFMAAMFAATYPERVSALVPQALQRPVQSTAEVVPDSAVVEHEREEFLRQFKAQLLEAHAEVIAAPEALCTLEEHHSGEPAPAEI